MKYDKSLVVAVGWHSRSLGRHWAALIVGALSLLINPRVNILWISAYTQPHHLFHVRQCITLFWSKTWKPNSCSHFLEVSTLTLRVKPGFKDSLAGNFSLTHWQNDLTVMFRRPFTEAFSHTNCLTYLFNHSLCHKTPLHWYLPCNESGKLLLLLKNTTLHSLIVRSLFLTVSPFNFAAFVWERCILVANKLCKRRVKDIMSPLCKLFSHSSACNCTAASSSMSSIDGSYNSSSDD